MTHKWKNILPERFEGFLQKTSIKKRILKLNKKVKLLKEV